VGGGGARETTGAGAGSGAAAGFITRVSFSPLRLPNTILLQAGALFCPQLPDQG
jgi:hypothetical protein